MQLKRRSQLGSSEPLAAERGEQTELNGGEQNFGRPEGKRGLEDGSDIGS